MTLLRPRIRLIGIWESIEVKRLKKKKRRDFPSGLVVRTLHFHWRGPGFNPWSGN